MGWRLEKIITSPYAFMLTATQDETAFVAEEMGLLDEPSYEWSSRLGNQCEKKLTACSVSATWSDECAIVIEPSKKTAFLMTVIREAMVALTTDSNFDRQVIANCLPFLRPYEIGDAFVSLTERSATPGGFPITPSHNHNHAIFTRF